MSYYYKYKFVSPEPLYARIREENKAYFNAGMIDDLLFPLWTNDCLQKLGRSSIPIHHTLLFQDNFEAKLPPDYIDFREVWLTTSILSPEFRRPGAYYQQITTALDKPYDPCNAALACDPCNPEILTFTVKTTTDITQQMRLKHLLKPGNISVMNGRHDRLPREHLGCLNYSSTAMDTFDIRDCKMITNFRHGDVYLIYYGKDADNSGNELIPENFRIQDYIRKYLNQKIFEILFKQITDESFNQMERKLQLYTKDADEAFIMADIEIKKKTIYEKTYAIRRDEHRNDKYRLDRGHGRWKNRGYPASSWGFND